MEDKGNCELIAREGRQCRREGGGEVVLEGGKASWVNRRNKRQKIMLCSLNPMLNGRYVCYRPMNIGDAPTKCPDCRISVAVRVKEDLELPTSAFEEGKDGGNRAVLSQVRTCCPV